MIKIYGSSDDLLEIDGVFQGENEFGCYNKPITIEVVDPALGTAVAVTATYGFHKCSAAVWGITVEPIGEDLAMPEMKIELAENGYSPMLVINCSEKTIVKLLEIN